MPLNLSVPLMQKPSGLSDAFHRGALRVATAVGSHWAFGTAILVVLAWALLGPVFRYSDTWQLIINTGTTIITFLMVFLIQATQNRDSRALHLKLDELLRAIGRARTTLVGLESMSDAEVAEFEKEFQLLRQRLEQRRQRRGEAKERDKAGDKATPR